MAGQQAGRRAIGIRIRASLQRCRQLHRDQTPLEGLGIRGEFFTVQCSDGTISIVVWHMVHQATRLPRIAVSIVGISIVGTALLATPSQILAQRGGGGGGRGAPSTGISGGVAGNRPDGVSDSDGLKDFHRAIAIQATADQRAAFARIVQYTDAANNQLLDFRKSLPQVPASVASALTDRASTLDQALEKARAGSQNFLASFSPAQKSGLQELTRKLGKADSDLDKQIKTLDQIVHTAKSETEPIANSASALDKALASFQSEQLALGKEMSILFPDPGQGVTFSLPPVTNSIRIAGQSVYFPVSGAVVSRALPETSVPAASVGTSVPATSGPEKSGLEKSAQSALNLFSLKLVADLSDLQHNITGILRSQLTRSPRCGERIEIQQATLTPLAPASLVVANLHFERWACPLGTSQGQNPIEVSGGDATLEVKLTPSVNQNTGVNSAGLGNTGLGNTGLGNTGLRNIGLVLTSEITRVEAEGFLRDLLRSGDLGVTLREEIAASVLSALEKGADLKATLPPVAQPSATIQKVLFQDDGADQMSMVLDGQLQFSDEQTQQFAAQLKQRVSAQGQGPGSTPP